MKMYLMVLVVASFLAAVLMRDADLDFASALGLVAIALAANYLMTLMEDRD